MTICAKPTAKSIKHILKSSDLAALDDKTILIIFFDQFAHCQAIAHGSCEDIFTLQSFAEMIAESIVKLRSFIFAFVLTEDSKGFVYASIYPALEFNKILYRIEGAASGEFLRHKAVYNPSNNVLIRKKVAYYVIYVDSAITAITAYLSKKSEGKHTSMMQESGLTDNLWGSDILLFDTNMEKPSEDVIKPPNRLVYRAEYLGSEDDYLTCSAFRQIFEHSVMNPTTIGTRRTCGIR